MQYFYIQYPPEYGAELTTHVIGNRVGLLPNEDGGQDYRGYNITEDYFSLANDGEIDSLTEEEVIEVEKDSSNVARLITPELYEQTEALYNKTREQLSSLGYKERINGFLCLDNIERDAQTRAEQEQVLRAALEKANKIINSIFK